MKTKKIQPYELIIALIIILGLFICFQIIHTKGDDGPKEPVTAPIIVNPTKITVEYYFDPLLNLQIDQTYQDSVNQVVGWANKLAEDLTLQYAFEANYVESWNAPTKYDSSRIHVYVSSIDEAPIYNISSNYIRVPHPLYQDPIVLLHELIHYINQSHLHVHKVRNEWKFSGCYIREKGCLNLMGSTRNVVHPLTFLLTEEQVKVINQRKGDSSIIEGDGNNFIFNKFPKELVESVNQNPLIECCGGLNFTPEGTNNYFAESFGERNLDNSEIDFRTKYFNDVFNILLDEELCPREIAKFNINKMKSIIVNKEEEMIKGVGFMPGMEKDSITSYNAVVNELVCVMDYKNDNDKKLEYLFNKESEYLNKKFGVSMHSNKSIRDIRRSSYDYMKKING